MASEAHELRHGIILDGPSAVGWDEACPINETLDGSGNPPPPELQGFGQDVLGQLQTIENSIKQQEALEKLS